MTMYCNFCIHQCAIKRRGRQNGAWRQRVCARALADRKRLCVRKFWFVCQRNSCRLRLHSKTIASKKVQSDKRTPSWCIYENSGAKQWNNVTKSKIKMNVMGKCRNTRTSRQTGRKINMNAHTTEGWPHQSRLEHPRRIIQDRQYRIGPNISRPRL